jgi:hypothetical protein
MASQSANKVGFIKIPNGQHKQTGKEILEELYRVHFPESVGEEGTLQGQGAAKPESICCSQGGLETV